MFVRAVPGLFPPDLVVQVKALACELPAKHDRPLSRWTTTDLVQHVQESGLVASVSGSTLWRWLHEDAIRPWYHRSWVFPRDPEFAEKAGRILDLYARQWQGKQLKDDDLSSPPTKRRAFRHGAGSTLPRAAVRALPCASNTSTSDPVPGPTSPRWTSIQARVFGRCEVKNGILPFDRLVEQTMTRPPYNDARRVFWIVDNCSAHRGAKAAERLHCRYPRLTLVHAPVHISWLNQIEIYFSIAQRNVLTPNDFPDLNALAERLLNFQYYWETAARPFQWKFTRQDLVELAKLRNSTPGKIR